jgi:putative transcriptional regulator
MVPFIETKLFTSLIGKYLSDDENASFTLQGHTSAKSGCLRSMQRTSRKAFLQKSCDKSVRTLMAKAKRNLGIEILQGVREIKRGDHGRVAKVPAVADVREQTGLSQAEFAKLMGVSVRTLQEWEQGRRAPSGAARTLILIAAKNPAALAQVT